jgi:selenoprotein W-related protein
MLARRCGSFSSPAVWVQWMAAPLFMAERPRIEIEYCTECRWLLRAAWMAQELLTSFAAELGGVALIPGSGGVFDVRLDGSLVWSRAERRRFPDIKELKQLVRDRVAPTRSLGHSDGSLESTNQP